MYDLWLTKGCSILPDLQDFIKENPGVITPSISENFLEHSPGFLGLNLTKSVAVSLLRGLQTGKGRGMFVLSDYRTPKYMAEDVLYIAKDHIIKYTKKRYPEYTLGEIRFLYEHAMWWTFGANILELVNRGVVPGAIFACIDKLDRHIWEPGTMEHVLEINTLAT